MRNRGKGGSCKRWTLEEDALLRRMFLRGESIGTIAPLLHRTYSAVLQRAQIKGLYKTKRRLVRDFSPALRYNPHDPNNYRPKFCAFVAPAEGGDCDE